MSEPQVYLDCAATTPIDPAVLEAMLPFLRDEFANPAAGHRAAATAAGAVERARDAVAALLGARSSEIVFTGSGSESNNTAVKGIATPGAHLITTAVEHESVLAPCRALEARGCRLTILPVDGCGRVDPDDVERAITAETALISVMHANNETGTLQPVADIGRAARSRGVLFHVDAVQTCGHVQFRVDELNADLVTVSAHKLNGPKGVAALYVRESVHLDPLVHGGAQEAGRRAGTSNVPGIVGFGRAAELSAAGMADESRRVADLRQRLSERLLATVDEARVNGHPELRTPGVLSLSFCHASGELLVEHLDRAGVACATGAACRESDTAPSHVLTAMGLEPEWLDGTVRLSLGRTTTEADVDHVLTVMPEVVHRVRGLTELLD